MTKEVSSWGLVTAIPKNFFGIPLSPIANMVLRMSTMNTRLTVDGKLSCGEKAATINDSRIASICVVRIWTSGRLWRSFRRRMHDIYRGNKIIMPPYGLEWGVLSTNHAEFRTGVRTENQLNTEHTKTECWIGGWLTLIHGPDWKWWYQDGVEGNVDVSSRKASGVGAMAKVCPFASWVTLPARTDRDRIVTTTWLMSRLTMETLLWRRIQ